MEKTLNVQLFERTRKGINTTPQGRELLLSARRCLRKHRVLPLRPHCYPGWHGYLPTWRHTDARTLPTSPYPEPCARAPHRSETICCENAPSDLETGLINGQHDLILTTLPIMSKELVVAPLFRTSKLALAKDHRLGNKTKINRMDLLGEPVLTITNTTSSTARLRSCASEWER